MTTLIYKFSPKFLGRSKHALMLCDFSRDEGGEFAIKLPEDGTVLLAELERTTKNSVCKFSYRELSDGLLTLKAIIGGRLYTAEPLVKDGEDIIPTDAGASAVIELARKVGKLEEKLAELSTAVNELHEKIGTNQIFKII